MSGEPIPRLNAALAGRYQVERTGSSLTVGSPSVLFEDPYMRDTGGTQGVANYDVSLSDDRFVMVEDGAAPAPLQLHVVLNWFEELRARVPN